MKATGIVRKVDELGRIVIPIELRRTMGIDIKDPLEIFVDGEKIILRKYEPTCIFSGSSENLINFKGKMVSRDILDELIESFDHQAK
ncbi:transcriptional pleiotropic regulator of transition state genes [Paenibacillus sophorae]|uniref:AbrB/MazE/SpoVT family DNA-binding domain-containing protein n=1 Tax=Paenibacillus sophorae TaxID=1333845 RepID=A0A1H8MIJ3_9BACL|nr:AbrB/MazE/SpoVT family DNA-binding domain-containing protein [Paenibacillus sophorae]QWU17824.1 AbrB/MazE/SpoVT family DNA-binding domain-containing protein [Paenibacillus sophorae]SEO17100.1 transcriptional pleiotropic regulator of transition state genes [Paenibacillus sophorae]